MSTVLTNKQKEVIRKILYAVETGGQVYGNVRYSDFTEAYTNSSAEHAITIGGGAWYATEAQKLLNLIRKTYPATFSSLDNQGIASDLDAKNWSTYKLAKTSAKAKCIVSIISSEDGIKCQDSLMDSQIETYSSAIQKKYGDMTADAIAECINIRHQGGNGALSRILAKTAKPYSAKTIYAALCTDPDDKSNNNQVGDYTTRQKKVYEMIQTHLIPTLSSVSSSTPIQGGNTMTENELRQKVVSIAKEYYGCKKGDSKHKAIIDGYNAVKPLARGYSVTYTDHWCATFVSFVGIKAGLKDIIFRECGCGAMIQLFKNAGRWIENDAYVPKAGDIVMYDWDDNGSGDCTGYPEHVGIVVSVSGSTIKVIEGNMGSGSTVGYRDLAVNGRYIRGYCIPNYASKATSSGSTTSTPTTAPTTNPSTGSSSTQLNKTEKWKGYVTADELNVRTWAGTDNKTVSFSPLKENTEVGVCDSVTASNGVVWYYIKYNGKYGFVSSKYISRIVETTEPSTPANQSSAKVEYAKSFSKSIAGTYKVTAKDGLNMRTGAGTSKTKLCTIPYGKEVSCYGYYTSVSGVKWYFVSYKTYTGFVSSQYLKR